LVVSPADRRVIALGNLVGELKSSLEDATSKSGIELVLTREPAKALVELERASAVAVLVDMATLGAEQFCKRARGTERLRGVPIIGMSRTPSELGFARVFAWGADDLVPLGATPALARRLSALASVVHSEQSSFGQAVVAEGTTQRRALLGRVLVHAGYDVKFAVDRGSVELYASQAETRIVVISATLGDPRKLIESASKAGGLATWIITAEARSVARLAASLAGLERVVVTSTAGSPEDILFLANEIVFGKGGRQREWRALYGTPVAFRPLGATTDDYGFTYDVSPGGLYVRSLVPCESEEVEVDLRPPERDERVRLLGKVVRRFAFGSGSVASAPPGFGVKVTGPTSPALKLWVEACRAYVEKVGSGSPPEAPTPPPVPKAESSSSLPALAVPAPNVTIESVVLPLPSERTDVADLLSQTLGEEAPPEAGTRPVTVDAETGGVREERPSEYGMGLEGTEASLTPPPDPNAAPPEPAPVRQTSRPPLPMPVAPARPEGDDHDDTTSVFERSEIEAFAQKRDREAALAMAHNPTPMRPPAEFEPITLVPEPDTEPTEPPPVPPPIPRAARPVGAPPPAAPLAPPVAAPQAPPLAPPVSPPAAPPITTPVTTPVTTPGAFAGTVAMARPPATLGGTVVLPPPGAPRGAPVAPPAPAAAAPFAPTAPPLAPPVAAPPPVAALSPSPLASPPDPVVLEPPTPHMPLVTEAPSTAGFSAYGAPSVQATSRGFPVQVPPVESLPRAVRPAEPHAEVPVPSVERVPTRSPALIIVIGLLALGLGVGGGVWLLRFKTAPAPETSSSAPEPAPSAASPVENVPPSPTPEASAASEPSPSAAPTTGAAPDAPVASASAPPVETAPPATPLSEMVPPPTFDLQAIPGDRAALLVKSSVQARVFVHGKDYGETNRYLLTSCGIRHVRIGRGFNDFLEAGGSQVLKCGKLTEITIEPKKK
jgi:hypothetical protein